jgi:hypothetical protein
MICKMQCFSSMIRFGYVWYVCLSYTMGCEKTKNIIACEDTGISVLSYTELVTH